MEGDELQAKAIWCLEGLVVLHSEFTSAHGSMRSGDVIGAFDRIERILTAAPIIRRHLNDAGGKFGLELIHNTGWDWVTLLDPPYGISHGSIIKRAHCSICQTRVGVLWPCGHIKGEIYGGMLCIQIHKEITVTEVSIVERPASLILTNHRDQMLKGADKFADLARKLPSPYALWVPQLETDLRRHPAYRDAGRNDRCPCGSGRKFKRCCAHGHPNIKHWNISVIDDYSVPNSRRQTVIA